MSTENEKFVIASEMTVEHFQLGTPQEALGTTLILNDSTIVEIIGIIKNYQYAAVFLNLKPMLLRYIPGNFHHAFLRLDSPNMTSTVSKLERTWKKIDPIHEFNGDFLDGRIRFYYTFFEDIMYTVGFASLLAIIIAGFGLLGMATYSTQTRLREIGVRKVLGARFNDVVKTLSKQFMILLVAGTVFAAPVAWYANTKILQSMTHHINVGFPLFANGFAIMLGIGFTIIFGYTYRAARANPVDALRYE